jgi:hypothetical protein
MTMHLSDQGLIVILVVAHCRMTAGQDCPRRIPDPDALLAVAAWVKAKCRVAGAAQRAQGRPLRAIAAEMLRDTFSLPCGSLHGLALVH